jgi:hypothetical protein
MSLTRRLPDKVLGPVVRPRGAGSAYSPFMLAGIHKRLVRFDHEEREVLYVA